MPRPATGGLGSTSPPDYVASFHSRDYVSDVGRDGATNGPGPYDSVDPADAAGLPADSPLWADDIMNKQFGVSNEAFWHWHADLVGAHSI